MHEVTFLRHKCTDKGILPSDVIKNYPVPRDSDSARRFVAFCNYYTRFIRNFADYSHHITKLCKKNVKFEWTADCQHAFNSSTEISTGIVSSVQLWAKETGIIVGHK